MTDTVKVKEGVGVLVAAVVVFAYIGIGFVQVGTLVTMGSEVKMPPDWMAAMLSLASAALGFLIGKQSAPTLPASAVLPPWGTAPAPGSETAAQAPLPAAGGAGRVQG